MRDELDLEHGKEEFLKGLFFYGLKL